MTRISDLPPDEQRRALLARHRGRLEAYRRAKPSAGRRLLAAVRRLFLGNGEGGAR